MFDFLLKKKSKNLFLNLQKNIKFESLSYKIFLLFIILIENNYTIEK